MLMHRTKATLPCHYSGSLSRRQGQWSTLAGYDNPERLDSLLLSLFY